MEQETAAEAAPPQADTPITKTPATNDTSVTGISEPVNDGGDWERISAKRLPRGGVPVDALEPLKWPSPFQPLAEYFRTLMPCAVFDLPGWRFVCASQEGDGLWIGCLARDGAVRQIAYAMRGEPEKGDARPYRMRRGLDGAMYRTLVQRAG